MSMQVCPAQPDTLLAYADVSTDVGIRYKGLPPGLTAYEQTAAAFIFINFLLAIAATIFAMKVRHLLVMADCCHLQGANTEQGPCTDAGSG